MVVLLELALTNLIGSKERVLEKNEARKSEVCGLGG
jgi:hypothetical protein